MELQKYVTEVIETLGGVVVPVEYALCQVLIPEEYKDYFQGRTEIELAFDFEVAQENPESEFVTFGSYLLEQMLALATQKARSTVRFAEVERIELAHSLKKIQSFMSDEPGQMTITDERYVMGVWALFQFKVNYVSDEKEETTREVWVDLLTDQVDAMIHEQKNRIVYHHAPLYTYPFPKAFDIQHGFETAFTYILQRAEDEKQQRLQDKALQYDVDRIQDYYTELIKENEKRATKKGLTEEKKEDIYTKTKAIEVERDKQLHEIKNKYDVHIEAALEHGILYLIPVIKYRIDIHFRGTRQEKVLYYNPITKQFKQL